MKKLPKKVEVAREELVQKIENVPYKEKELCEEYLHIFDNLRETIRLFERKVKFNPSSKDVYALCTLYREQREVIADIRSVTDYTEHANKILHDVIQPLYVDIVEMQRDYFHHVRKLLIENCKDNKVQSSIKKIEDLTKEQAKFLQEKAKLTKIKIEKALVSR